MATLARNLKLHDYFALAFGTMIGTGWLVLMDDWLGRGGPLGAMLGFVLGGLILLPVGYVYGQWVLRLPDAAGEAAYTAQVFPPAVSYFTGWAMLLSYFIVCPWEAVALGKIAAYIFPWLDSMEVYRIAGKPVFLYRLLLGIALTVFLTLINYRGIRLSANFQKVMTSAVIGIFLVLVLISGSRGSIAHVKPLFHATPLVSILLTLQIVPYFITGFESVPKYSVEAKPGLRGSNFMVAIAMTLGIGVSFYALCIAAVSYIAPWQGLLGKRFATAIAFEQALGAHWPVQLILVMAMFGLFQCFNGNFAASTRMLFAFGRNGTVVVTLGRVHPVYQTPGNSILAIGAGTLVALFLGDSVLGPVTEVGSASAAFGWFASCISMVLLLTRSGKPSVADNSQTSALTQNKRRLLVVAGFGTIAALALVLMKFLPMFPGHFSLAEYVALGVWILIGMMLRRSCVAWKHGRDWQA